jgi:hypothetical protein
MSDARDGTNAHSVVLEQVLHRDALALGATSFLMMFMLQAKRLAALKDENRQLKENLGAHRRELKICKARLPSPHIGRLWSCSSSMTLRPQSGCSSRGMPPAG